MFGYSVSLNADGTTLAIGARENDGNGSGSSNVQIYQKDALNPSNWTQIGNIDGKEADDCAGRSVSLSADGTIVAIGADEYIGTPAGSDKGYVQVYQRDTNNPDGWS